MSEKSSLWSYVLSRDFWLLNLYLFLFGILIVWGFVSLIMPVLTRQGEAYPIPKVVGKHYRKAIAIIEKAGFTWAIDSVSYSIRYAPGEVIAQDPLPWRIYKGCGKRDCDLCRNNQCYQRYKAKLGRTIYLKVNKTVPDSVQIPPYSVTVYAEDYKPLLEALELEVIVDTIYDALLSEEEIGKVSQVLLLPQEKLLQDGAYVPRGSRILLKVLGAKKDTIDVQ